MPIGKIKKDGEALNMGQVLAVLKAARAVSERDWLMCLLSVRHGMRVSEVCNLRTTDVDPSNGLITVARLKGSKHTVQPLLSDTNPLLDEKAAVTALIRGLPVGERLFPITRGYAWKRFVMHCEAARIPAHLTKFHNLKHTTGMSLIGSVTLPELQLWMGHVNLENTAHYLKANNATACASVAAAFRTMGQAVGA